MKFVALLVACSLYGCGCEAVVEGDANPITKVLELVGALKGELIDEGEKSADLFDESACASEETLSKTAASIAENKAAIEKYDKLIVKLKGELGAHGADIKSLKEDIADTKAALADAKALFAKQKEKYETENMDALQQQGALAAALKVFADMQESISVKPHGPTEEQMQGSIEDSMKLVQIKPAFLAAKHTVQAVPRSVLEGVRSVFSQPSVMASASESDMESVMRFVNHPNEFLPSAGALSAAQVGSGNPFGDYSSQSTGIVGILKQTLADSRKETAEATKEFEKVKAAHNEFVSTKSAEQTTLEDTLKVQKEAQGRKKVSLAESEEGKATNTNELNENEELFAKTKAAAIKKANEFSVETKLRTQELQGIEEAVGILTSDKAKKAFAVAYTEDGPSASFLELSSSLSKSSKLYKHLNGLASKYHSASVAEIAAKVQAQATSGAGFDHWTFMKKVAAQIEKVISDLRAEEAADVEAKDQCENTMQKHANDMEDAEHAAGKAKDEMERLAGEAKGVGEQIEDTDTDIRNKNEQLNTAKELRRNQRAQYLKDQKECQTAVQILNQALAAISEFGAKHGDNAIYGGKKQESKGINSIFEYIIEDVKKSCKQMKKEEDEAQADFEETRGMLEKYLSEAGDRRLSLLEQQGELNEQHADAEDEKDSQNAMADNKLDSLDDTLGEEGEAGDEKGYLKNCADVIDKFSDRRNARKEEIAGLQQAIAYLTGDQSNK